MKKLILQFLFIVSVSPLFAQFDIGFNTGVVFPNFEESGMFNPSPNLGSSFYYTTNNVIVGVHFNYIINMTLKKSWAEEKFGGDVKYNSVYSKYSPTLFLSLAYLISNSEYTSVYLGLNGGVVSTSIQGIVKVGSSQLSFDGEKHTDIAISPKIGFSKPLRNEIRWQGEIVYNILSSEYKTHLISLNLGLVMPIQSLKALKVLLPN